MKHDMHHPEFGPAQVGDWQLEEFAALGYVRADVPVRDALHRLAFVLGGHAEDWLPAFRAAGIDSPEALSESTVEQLDALPVSGLGPVTAQRLIDAATEFVVTED